ncbi:reverse transcriptase domain-containing protein [Tanacetum coccineum]
MILKLLSTSIAMMKMKNLYLSLKLKHQNQSKKHRYPPYKPKIPYPQRLRKEKMEAQYGKFLDMIQAIRINVPLFDVLAGMPNYGKFLKELFPQNLEALDVFSFHVTSTKLSYIMLANLGSSINLMPYSLYAKLSLETLKPTKMSIRLAEQSFQFLIGIAENMLVKVGKFTFPTDFVILEMKEDNKVPLILGRPFLHTTNAVIRVKQNIDVIDEILEEDFDSLLDEGSESSIPLKEPSSKKNSLLNSTNSWK